MIKAIFFDIDGTLVSFNTHEVPQSTKECLEKLRQKGVKLFIATGRSPQMLEVVKKVIDFKFDGYVTINGQYCLVDGKEVHSMKIPVESLEKMIPYIEEKNIACEFVEIDHMYINCVNDRVKELREYLGDTAPSSKVEDLDIIYKKDIYQLCAYIKEHEEDEFLSHLPNCKAVRWNSLFADIIPAGGGKDVGIGKILEYLEISREECMAFGDGGNDISMLKYVGTGVAMGNAGDDVKKIADYVTESVDNDGIKSALEKLNVL